MYSIHSMTNPPPFPSGDNFILMTVCLRQPLDSIAINHQITRLPLYSFTLPPRHPPPPLQEGDSSSTNQRAAQIITHLGPPLFLICTFDRWCLFLALIASSFHHNLMFVSCRFLGDGCERKGYNFYIKEVVMNDWQVE